jgi:hypothetical protein
MGCESGPLACVWKSNSEGGARASLGSCAANSANDGKPSEGGFPARLVPTCGGVADIILFQPSTVSRSARDSQSQRAQRLTKGRPGGDTVPRRIGVCISQAPKYCHSSACLERRWRQARSGAMTNCHSEERCRGCRKSCRSERRAAGLRRDHRLLHDTQKLRCKKDTLSHFM